MRRIGSELTQGDMVRFRPSGRHYDLYGEVVMLDGVLRIRILQRPDIPEELHGAIWGLWPNHRYLVVNE